MFYGLEYAENALQPGFAPDDVLPNPLRGHPLSILAHYRNTTETTGPRFCVRIWPRIRIKCLYQATKITVGSVVHAAELNWKWNFLSTRSVLWPEVGLCRKWNAFVAWGSSWRSLGPSSRLGARGPLPRLHPTRRLRRSGLPLHIISGYATDLVIWSVMFATVLWHYQHKFTS